MRARSRLAAIGLVMASLLHGPQALAQDADGHDDTTSDTPTGTAPEGSVGIGDGIFLTGMVITPPDGPPRTLDAEQAAAFTQAMLAQAYFGPPGIKKDPPADLPVSVVEISGQFLNDVGVLTVHYADDGTTPFVAFPGLVINPEPIDPPPAPEGWFMAPPLVRDAFNGTAELAQTDGAASTTTAPPVTEAAAASDDDSDSSALPIVAGIAALVVLAGGAVWLVRRRRTDGDAPDDGPGDAYDAPEEVSTTVTPDA